MLPAIAPVNTDRKATQMTMSQKVIFSTVNDSTTQKWNSCASLSLTFIRSPPCVCVLDCWIVGRAYEAPPRPAWHKVSGRCDTGAPNRGSGVVYRLVRTLS